MSHSSDWRSTSPVWKWSDPLDHSEATCGPWVIDRVERGPDREVFWELTHKDLPLVVIITVSEDETNWSMLPLSSMTWLMQHFLEWKKSSDGTTRVLPDEVDLFGHIGVWTDSDGGQWSVSRDRSTDGKNIQLTSHETGEFLLTSWAGLHATGAFQPGTRAIRAGYPHRLNEYGNLTTKKEK